MLPINCYLSKTLVLSKNSPLKLFSQVDTPVSALKTVCRVRGRFKSLVALHLFAFLPPVSFFGPLKPFPCYFFHSQCPQFTVHSPLISPPVSSCSSIQILRKLPVPSSNSSFSLIPCWFHPFFLSSSVDYTVSLSELKRMRKWHCPTVLFL